ncbi:hypothetical protein IWQ56_006056, partial [Coemansia nantahalensis]
MVDPSASAPADIFGAGPPHALAGASRSSLASAHTDYSPGPGRHHGSGRFDGPGSAHSLHQQPTLAALALADSRGQLDSGLGYYYQQPHRMRADMRAGPGFYSEPASGAGSPVPMASSPDSLPPRMRSVGSADHAMGALLPAGSALALGVVFPATAAASPAKTMVEAAGPRASAGSSSRLNSRDSSHMLADPGGELSGHTALPHGLLTALPEDESLPGGGGGGGGDKNNGVGQHLRRHHNHQQQRMAQSSAEFAPPPSHTTTPSASAASLTAASGSFSFQNGHQRVPSHHQPSLSIASQLSAPQQQQQPPQLPPRAALPANSNSSANRHSTAMSTTRDSMFLRFKEKMRYFKPRSRPQSDNLTDRRDVPGAPQPYAVQQMGSPLQDSRAT